MKNKTEEKRGGLGQGMFSPRAESKNPLLEEARPKHLKVKRQDYEENKGAPAKSHTETTSSKKAPNHDLLQGLGAEFRASANEKSPFAKKRTLHMYDFKKFKYMKTEDVHKRYKFTDKKLG